MSINDILPSEILVSAFKRLNSKQVVQVREVCKEWQKLVDENRMFWRILVLSIETFEGAQAVMDQFDEKSGSTMEGVELEINRLIWQTQGLIHSLQNSRASLSTVVIKVPLPGGIGESLAETLLLTLPNLADFRVGNLNLRRCQLLRVTRADPEKLQVLWIPSFPNLPNQRPLFQTLTSLRISRIYHHSEWREILALCSKTLKHLDIGLKSGRLDEIIFPLEFSLLEVFEIRLGEENFPTWMVVPQSLKLFDPSNSAGLPSISILWIYSFNDWEELSNRCPCLQIFRLDSFYSGDMFKLVNLLSTRRDNVDHGLEIERVKMEPLRKLVIPFKVFSQSELEQLRGLVGEVVDAATEPLFWKVEI